jgi:isopenicillin N synthase-like dioxygenase
VQVLTNALYKSVAHQAVVNRTQARISLAYFFSPQTGVEIVPAPDIVDRITRIEFGSAWMSELSLVWLVQNDWFGLVE